MIVSIDSDDKAEYLRPSEHQPELTFVLFVDPVEPLCEHAIEKLTRMTWPRGVRVAIVDVVAAPVTAAWFGVRSGPALAAIYDAALLAIEHECSEHAFDRLLANAREQMELMDWV